jgi:ectoine hydroxylase
MIDPVEQVFGEKVCTSTRSTPNPPHRDVWNGIRLRHLKRDDGMLEPRAMNIAIFPDEVMPINGPLMLVPKASTPATRLRTISRPRPIR